MSRKNAWPEVEMRRIQAVEPLENSRLRVVWEEGETSEIDLAAWIDSNDRLAPLQDRELFGRAEVGEFGATVAWDGERFEIDALHLAFLEMEQEGVPVAPGAFKRWRERNGLSLTGAAKALGVSRRMVSYYEAGTYFVPKHIGLACKGYETLAKEKAA